MQIGIVGLGRMGANIARRLMRAGHTTVVYDINAASRDSLAADGATPARAIEELVGALAAPRAVWVMLPAGAITESTIETLARQELSDEALSKIAFVTPEQVILALDALDIPPVEESVVNGYKVKVRRTVVSPAEAKDRRAAVARVIARSMRNMKQP